MKKNISRALSLLLVLVMILGVMPVALANGNSMGDDDPTDVPATVQVNGPTTAKVNEPVSFTAVAPTGYEFAGRVNWTNADGNSTTATATFDEAGTYTVSVSANVVNSAEGGERHPVTGSATITVTAASVNATAIAITGDAAMTVGGEQTLSIVKDPADGTLPATVSWSSSDPSVASVSSSGKVAALKAGATTITATCGDLSDTFTITVTNDAVKLTVNTPSLTLAPKQTGKIEYRVTGATAEQVTVTMTPDSKSIATVVSSTGVVTAVAAGTTYITVKATLTSKAPSSLRFEGNKTSVEVKVPVTVEDQYYIVCANQSAVAGSTITLTPVLYDGSGNRVTNATFTYSSSNCTVRNSNNQTFYVSSNTASAASVTFTANVYKNGDADVTKTVNLGFYKTNSLKVSVRDSISSFRFYDKNVFQSAIGGSQNYTNLTNLAMEDLIGYAMPVTSNYNDVDFYSFGVSGSNGGNLLEPTSGTSMNWGSSTKYVDKRNLSSVGFQQRSSTNKTSNFTVYAMAGTSTDSVIVGMLTLQINAGAASGGIEYSTTYNKAVTFKTTDFQNYWNAHKNDAYNAGSGSYTTETLRYVTFAITNTVPAYGTLYATTSKTPAATAGMKFYATSNYTSGTYNYALSGVTYVPSTSQTASYTVDIPFTAYGSSGSSLSGYVTIKLNEQGNTIGARGTTIDAAVAESIAANYYNAKGQTMGYVVFDLPSAQQATLFRSIPTVGGYNRVTEATRAQSTDKFYYYTTYTGSSTSQSGIYSEYYGTSSYDCGCHNRYACYNTNCAYYDGSNFNNPDCGCHNQTTCYNLYCTYYDGTSTTNSSQYSANQLKLTDVSVVPAAGYKGTLTLTYTAYNAGGANPYTGYITYDVETKTASAVFSDVKDSYSWAADSADFLYYEGTAQGSNGKYNPKSNITRGDFMLMLYRAFLESEYGTTAVTSNFSDVVKGNTTYSQETYQAVGIAKQLGIAQGTNEKFNPTSKITREEAMVLIYRTLNTLNRSLRYKSSTSASSFGDYKNVSSWATTAISDLVSHGVIQGSNERINPKSNITRAEMACILHRVITY